MIVQKRLDDRDQARLLRRFPSYPSVPSFIDPLSPDERRRQYILGERARLMDTVHRVAIFHGILTAVLLFFGHYSGIHDLPTSELIEVLGADIAVFRWLWGPFAKLGDILFP